MERAADEEWSLTRFVRDRPTATAQEVVDAAATQAGREVTAEQVHKARYNAGLTGDKAGAVKRAKAAKKKVAKAAKKMPGATAKKNKAVPVKKKAVEGGTAGYGSQADFVRGLPESYTLQEVQAAGKLRGINISPASFYYARRGTTPAPNLGRPTGTPDGPNATRSKLRSEYATQLRTAVVRLGLDAAIKVIEEAAGVQLQIV